MPLNHYVTLGRSGLRVSPLCLGTMTFGKEWGWGSEPAEAKRIVDRFLERGGNFIDTANGYTKGHSEAIIGEHLAHDRKKRDRVVIATKFVTTMFLGDPNGGGSNRTISRRRRGHRHRRTTPSGSDPSSLGRSSGHLGRTFGRKDPPSEPRT